MQDDCKQPFYSVHDTTKFDSEDDYCTGCRNVSYSQQQPYLELSCSLYYILLSPQNFADVFVFYSQGTIFSPKRN